MSCKVIFHDGKRYCIYAEELQETKDGYYIPEIGITVDEISSRLFFGNNKAFSVIEEGNRHILVPISPEEFKELRKGKQETRQYTVTELGRGTYGAVSAIDPQNIVYKQFKNKTQDGIPEDILKEIAVYSLFGNFSCLPKYYGYEEDQKTGIKIYLEKGTGTLVDFIENKQNHSKRVPLMFQILKCMKVLHSQGIIHCDIKPTNIIITKEGNIQIIDFGLIEIEYDDLNPREKNAHIGSPFYQAPETILAKLENKYMWMYNYKVDIFSLGMILANIFNVFLLWNGMENSFHYHYLRQIVGIPKSEIYELSGKKSREVFKEYVNGKLDQITEIKAYLLQEYKLDEDVTDLLANMLCLNPILRISYKDALLHPCFQKIFRERIQEMPIFEIPDIPKKLSPLRTKIFEWLRNICTAETFKYSAESLALAYQLFDICTQFSDIKMRSSILGGICLSLATTLFEYESFSLDDIRQFIKGSNKEPLKQFQFDVLKVTNGNILIPTLVSTNKRKEITMTLDEVYLAYKN